MIVATFALIAIVALLGFMVWQGMERDKTAEARLWCDGDGAFTFVMMRDDIMARGLTDDEACKYIYDLR